jgi:predicted acylesterase/phospholipase RssA
MNPHKVAIACQGGGAQTAFTAGALHYLLYILGIEPELPPPPYPGARPVARDIQSGARCGEGKGLFEIVALSGTSGGAMSATMAWDELITRHPRKLQRFWLGTYPSGNAAARYQDAWTADLEAFRKEGEWPWLRVIDRFRVEFGLWMLEDPPFMALLPFHTPIEFKPYYFSDLFDKLDELMPPFVSSWLEAVRATSPPVVQRALQLSPVYPDSTLRRELDTQDMFRELLKQTLAVDVEAIRQEFSQRPLPPAGQPDTSAGPGIDEKFARELQGKLNEASELEMYLEPDEGNRVDRTNFRSFRGTQHLDSADSLIDCMLASAAIPAIMRGPVIDGSVHWDGLFSQNPPIYELPDVHGESSPNNPSQIWVVRINPLEVANVPKSAKAIADRRNELSGNLSLLQELRAIHTMNGVIKVRGSGGGAGFRSYQPVAFGFIDMTEDFAAPLDYASKLDRRVEKLWQLYRHGIEQAHVFYQRWKRWSTRRSAGKHATDSGQVPEILPELLIGAVDVQHTHRYAGDVA